MNGIVLISSENRFRFRFRDQYLTMASSLRYRKQRSQTALSPLRLSRVVDYLSCHNEQQELIVDTGNVNILAKSKRKRLRDSSSAFRLASCRHYQAHVCCYDAVRSYPHFARTFASYLTLRFRQHSASEFIFNVPPVLPSISAPCFGSSTGNQYTRNLMIQLFLRNRVRSWDTLLASLSMLVIS
jgi:hypothetical protein